MIAMLWIISQRRLYSYRLVPMGSFSRIEKTTGDKAVYELYGSGDLHIGRLLHNRRFDFAMVAFLDCLKQLIDFVKSQDQQVEFPHQYVSPCVASSTCSLSRSHQDREGQNRGGISQAAVQSGRGLDARTTPCPSGSQDSVEMGDQWQ